MVEVREEPAKEYQEETEAGDPEPQPPAELAPLVAIKPDHASILSSIPGSPVP